MNYQASVATLSMPLPEDIQKKKDAGDLTGAIRAIDCRLQMSNLHEQLRLRLICERERLLRLPTQYPYDHAEALTKARELMPWVTEADLSRYEDMGLVDFQWVNGEKRYFVRFHRSLAKLPALRPEGSPAPVSAHAFLDPMIAVMKEQGSMTRRYTVEASLTMTDSAFRPGRYEAWLPLPAACAQQYDFAVDAPDADFISDEGAEARTAHFTRTLEQNAPFSVRYSYTQRMLYADPLHCPAPAQPLYPNALPVCDDDLAEDGTYIRFTPMMRALEQSLSAGCASPCEKAWAYYRFVTEKVNYTFVRDYFQIDDLGEYCAVKLCGDCGLQALCFIVLCRIGGVPARWQSGLCMGADGMGQHDWAQFYLEGWGWLFADCSYGGSAFRCGAYERQAFYFGNLEPARMVANRVYMADFVPPMQGFRVDPYDSQHGEVLFLDRKEGEPFLNGRQIDGDYRVVSEETLA